MVRCVQVVVPKKRADEVIAVIEGNQFVHNVIVIPGPEQYLINFNAEDTRTGAVIKSLSDIGCGQRYGAVSIFALQTVMSREIGPNQQYKNTKREQVRKWNDRLPVEEIHAVISSQNKLGFDYIAMCAVAASIAGIGLVNNNVVVLVASMLVSPLMGPILGMTFSTIVGDMNLLKESLYNELLGTVVALMVGLITGLIASGIISNDLEATSEMIARGSFAGLFSGLAIAIPSGVGVALAVTAGVVNPLVGVAISASILPPIVNTGVCLSLALVHKNTALLEMAGAAAALFAVNLAAIYLVALIMFRLKQVNQLRKFYMGGVRKAQAGEPAPTPRMKDQKKRDQDYVDLELAVATDDTPQKEAVQKNLETEEYDEAMSGSPEPATRTTAGSTEKRPSLIV